MFPGDSIFISLPFQSFHLELVKLMRFVSYLPMLFAVLDFVFLGVDVPS